MFINAVEMRNAIAVRHGMILPAENLRRFEVANYLFHSAVNSFLVTVSGGGKTLRPCLRSDSCRQASVENQTEAAQATRLCCLQLLLTGPGWTTSQWTKHHC